jgi:hypothetical protein
VVSVSFDIMVFEASTCTPKYRGSFKSQNIDTGIFSFPKSWHVNVSESTSYTWKEWLAAEDYLLETIPTFLPLEFAEHALIMPINPFESSNLLELPTCLISLPTWNTLM